MSPCKDCADRHDGCHSECEKYKAYAEYREKVREKARLAGVQTDDGYIHKNGHAFPRNRRRKI